jgi:hypothetical protein
MMAADVALIAEVTLLSEGFDDANTLSRKIVQLYTLCAEQLSRQQHYDWGMRALKSVLVLAGALKREESALLPLGGGVNSVAVSTGALSSEDDLIMRALADANVPKLVGEDVLLFYGLLIDLFPFDVAALQRQIDTQSSAQHSVSIQRPAVSRFQASIGGFSDGEKPSVQYDSFFEPPPQQLPGWMCAPDTVRSRALSAALQHTLDSSGLQSPAPFLRKVMQLDATLQVRFGTAVVGGPGTGKSTMVAALAHSLSCIGARDAIPVFVERAKSPRGSRRADSGRNVIDAATIAAALGRSNQKHGVNVHVLNPKTVSLEGLFGRGNAVTGEWRDGLLSKLMRDASRGDVNVAIPPTAYQAYNISAEAFGETEVRARISLLSSLGIDHGPIQPLLPRALLSFFSFPRV